MAFFSRRWTQSFQKLPVVRRAIFWWVDRDYRRWRRANPDSDYGLFYAERITDQIADGRPHPTLGPKGWKGSQPVALDKAEFARRGAGSWQHYLEQGITPTDRVVDYGCGSLRLGQHAIAMLERDNYWGIDVTAEFYRQGLRLMDEKMIAEKRPKLSVISPETLAQLREWKPTFIFSNAVLQHVPPAETKSFLTNVASIITVGTSALLLFVAGPDGERYKAMNWTYSPDALVETVNDLDDDDVEGSIEPLSGAHQARMGNNRRWLRIRRRDI